MIDALVAGRIYGAVEERTSKNGNPYVVAKVRTTTASGKVVFVSVIAFNPKAVAALLALSEGDGVALSGELTANAWIDCNGTARPALDLVAHQVLTEYHVTRKRKALEAAT